MKAVTKKIINVGGSYSIIIPRAFAKQLGLQYGEMVAVIMKDDQIVIYTGNKREGDENEER